MSEQITQPSTPHHQRAIWPILGFAIAALLALAAILAFGEESNKEPESLTAVPKSIEPFCPPQKAPDFDLSNVVGEDLDDAQEWAEGQGMSVRPIVIDGEPQAVTFDYRKSRINVAIDDDEVIAYCGMF